MKGTSKRVLRIRTAMLLLWIWMALPACCPNGLYEDNFGAVYLLFTDFRQTVDDSFMVFGSVDTAEIGCGVWTLVGTSQKPGEDRLVEWTVTNPNPNPTDACCYAFQFVGQAMDVECLFISGQYETIGGKCTRSGPMYLEGGG